MPQIYSILKMKIGDKVRFLSEVGGGKVAGFQGKNIVLVEDEDGFQMPMLINEVVVVGDSIDKDIIPAREAGCHTVWFKGEGWTSDPVDESVPEQIITNLKALINE